MRLRMWSSAAAFVLMLICMRVSVAQQSVFEQCGVHLIRPNDVRFTELAAELNPRNDPSVVRMLPYSVILDNRSSKAIELYAFRVAVLNPADGRESIGTSVHGGPGSAGSLKPHSQRLLSVAFIGGAESGSYADLVDRYVREWEGRRVRIDLDGVLFENGEFIGPGRGHEFEELQQRYSSQRDLYSRILTLASNREALEGELQRLSKLERSTPDPDPFNATRYDFFMRGHIRQLLQFWKQGGIEKVLAEARNRTNLPPLRWVVSFREACVTPCSRSC